VTLSTTRMRRLLVFFFQAEDGIRDRTVTGVQTCALPILELPAVFPEQVLPLGIQFFAALAYAFAEIVEYSVRHQELRIFGPAIKIGRATRRGSGSDTVAARAADDNSLDSPDRESLSSVES